MAKVPDHNLRVLVKPVDEPGKVVVLDRFKKFTVTSDMMSPVDSWTLTLSDIPKNRGVFTHGGHRVEIFNHGAKILSGITDEPNDDVSVNSSDFVVSGRDVGGLLMDSDVPPDLWSIRGLSLAQIAEKLTAPWRPYVFSVITNNAANRYIALGAGSRRPSKRPGPRTILGGAEHRGLHQVGWRSEYTGDQLEKRKKSTQQAVKGRYGKDSPFFRGIGGDKLDVKIGPGQTVMSVLQRFARQIGAWLWFTVDGSLVIARPQYEQSPDVYGRGLVLRWVEKGKAKGDSNVEGVRYATTIANRNSEYLVLGQGASSRKAIGRALLKRQAAARDPSPAFFKRTVDGLGDRLVYKPKVIKVKRVSNEALVRRLARGMMEEAAVKAFQYEFMVNGHKSESGALWAIDSTVKVIDERRELTDTYFINKRVFSYSWESGPQGGEKTVISVIPRKIWLFEDHDKLRDDKAYERIMLQRIFW